MQIGGVAWQKVAWDWDRAIPGGFIVEVWTTDDGEVGMTTMTVKPRGAKSEIVMHRLLASECSSVEPCSSFRCWVAVRKIDAYLGQRAGGDASGPPYNDFEKRVDSWRRALLHAAIPTTKEAA